MHKLTKNTRCQLFITIIITLGYLFIKCVAGISQHIIEEDAGNHGFPYSRSLLRLKSSLLRLKEFRRFSRVEGIFNFQCSSSTIVAR